jgi:sec-independent protein translocase protein TatC
MGIPLYLLYEISVWIAWYWERQDRKREAMGA